MFTHQCAAFMNAIKTFLISINGGFLYRSIVKTIGTVTSALLDSRYERESVEKEPARPLVVYFGEALKIPLLFEADR